MRYGVLGPVLVVGDTASGAGGAVELGGPQPRALVAALVLAAGHVVHVDSLVDAVWGDDPPPSAGGTLQTYVSRLRRRLGADAPLRWRPPGYVLEVHPDDVDHLHFERLADEGRALLVAGDVAPARAVLEQALALWRGPALAEVAHLPWATGAAARLDERRLTALEDLAAADLALGDHARAVATLTGLVTDHPLREGLRATLARALYRSGRQADALRAIDAARRTLVEELGVDPGRELRELEAAILAHDPALDGPRPSAGAPEPAGRPIPPLPGGSPADLEPSPATSLVGRDGPLRELSAVLTEAATTTRVAIVEGEPGIGKTRLAEEVAALAARRGATVLWGRAFEGGSAPALWPWLRPLRSLAARHADDPGVRELDALLTRGSAPASGPGSAEVARFALVEGVAAVLAVATSDRPLVLVLDDLQWADATSLDLLVTLVAQVHDLPLLVLCTVRDLEVGRNDALVDALASLTRRPGTRRLRLVGLSPAATAALVGQVTDAPADPDVAAAIHARADGNPFFATELARLLDSGEHLADVPAGVRDVVRRRLAQLPAATRELLTVAAVVGRESDVGLLGLAAGSTLDEVLDGLEPALVHRLLVEVPAAPGTFRFSHALVREVLVDDLSTLRRARLHLRVASALDDGDDHLEILAEHLWEAAPVGVGRRAAEVSERAADVALHRHAYVSARTLLDRAAQLRRSASTTPEDRGAELDVLTRLAAVRAAIDGHISLTGSSLVTRAKRLATELGRVDDLLHLTWAEWAGLDLANRWQEADAAAAELLALVRPGGDPVTAVLGHTAWAISRWHRAEFAEASRSMDLASAELRSAAFVAPPATMFDFDQVRLAIPFGIYLHDLIGDLDDARSRYDEAYAAVAGAPYWVVIVANFEASAALSRGEPERAARAAARGMAADPETVSAFWSVALRCYLGAARCLAGDLDGGLPLLDASWRSYRAAGLRTNGVTWLASRTQALADAGRVGEAAASLAEAEEEMAYGRERYGLSALQVARAHVAASRGDDPTPHLRDALATALAQGASALAERARREARALGVDPEAGAVP